jgi:hypothetical protein
MGLKYYIKALQPNSFRSSELFTSWFLIPYFLNYGLLLYFLNLIKQNKTFPCDNLEKGLWKDMAFRTELVLIIEQCVVQAFLIIAYIAGKAKWWNGHLDKYKLRAIAIVTAFGCFDWLFLCIFFPIRMYHLDNTQICGDFDYVIFNAFLSKILVNSGQNIFSLAILPIWRARQLKIEDDLMDNFFDIP